MSETKNYMYQSIAQAIVDHGINTMFGLIGDANLFMTNHYVQSCGGTFVPAVHEGGAVLMALAYAQVSGNVGVATVTHGPALTNCITALTEGVRGNIPMVLFAGDTPVINSHNLQNIDQRELAKVAGAGFEQLRSVQLATTDIGNAFYRAAVEKRPIVLNMPADLMWLESHYEKVVFQTFKSQAFVPQGDSIDNALGIIASARRPVILAGSGAIDAREHLLALAEQLEAPVATTLKAKDLFKGHAANIGIVGSLGTPAALDVIGMSDCVISFGTSLHHFTTSMGSLMQGKRVVQVNESAVEICKNFRPDVAIVADAGLTAVNFLEQLQGAEIPASGFTKELDGVPLTIYSESGVDPTNEGYIDYIYALEKLEKALPENRILSTDGGRFMTEVWCRISAPDPKSFLLTANFGSIGMGLQEAIGAASAAPERPVVLFTGDGGFMMGGINEFNTAVRLKQDLIVVVCNDSAYGAEYIQLQDKNMSPDITTFEWPSFANVATALGGRGIQVRSTDELDEALDIIEQRNAPVLIDLVLNPNEVPRMRV